MFFNRLASELVGGSCSRFLLDRSAKASILTNRLVGRRRVLFINRRLGVLFVLPVPARTALASGLALF